MGKIETTQQENIDNQQPEKDKTPAAVASPPRPTHSHALPSSNQPETASVRKQFDHDEIESIPAVPFPPHHDPPETNKMQGAVAGGGGANAAVPVVIEREKSRKPHLVLIQGEGNPWSSGLFDCCQDRRNAIITTLAPCVTFGQIVEIVDNGSTSCPTGAALYFFLFLVICHWNMGVRYRRRLRNAYQLAEMPLTDRLAHTLFPLCALCQEFRELKNQGYDPVLGYNGVAAKIQEQMQQQSMNGATIPPTSQTMIK